MILEFDSWYLGYSQILEDCRRGAEKGYALILCHADVDAIAAARSLTFLLRADHIEYVLQPCPSYSSLETCLTASVVQNPPSAVVLLNLGGTRNLTHFFSQGQLSPHQTKLYVMDGRRPVHLSNVYAQDHVVVFWDPSHGIAPEDLPSDGDHLSGNESSDDSDDNSGDSESSSHSSGTEEEELQDSDEDQEMELELDGDDNLDDKQEQPPLQQQEEEDQDVDYDGEDEQDPADTTPTKPKKKKKKHSTKTTTTTTDEKDGHQTDSTQELEDDDEVEDDEDDRTATPPTQATTQASTTQQNTQQQPQLTPAELYQDRMNRLRAYYNNNSSSGGGGNYGTPSSFIVWELASSLRFKDHPDLLWLTMVGVTDAYLQSRLDVVGYATLAHKLQDACLKLFPPPDVYERAQETVYAEDLHLDNGTEEGKTKLTFSEQGRIVRQNDYKFFLLRPSSLYDSMMYSPYVSTQLQLWTKPGMQRFQELLARMGYPLEECQQPYSFMKPSLKRRLPEQLSQHVEEFGLTDLQFTSFFRVNGFSTLVSASDTAYAVTALLECPITANTTSSSTTTTEHHDHNQPKDATTLQHDWDLECFHNAYDALGPTTDGQKQKIRMGTHFAMQLQKYIIQTAIGLVTRGAITRLRHFRYAYITCTTTNGGGHGSGEVLPIVQQQQDNNNNGKEQYHVLAKPLALTRLAHYLMDMHRANGKWVGENKTRPLVLLAEQPLKSSYLIVGYEMQDQSGSLDRKNMFGQHFALVAQTLNGSAVAGGDGEQQQQQQQRAVARLDSFDAHVVEVAAPHAQRFLEQLHYLMDSV